MNLFRKFFRKRFNLKKYRPAVDVDHLSVDVTCECDKCNLSWIDNINLSDTKIECPKCHNYIDVKKYIADLYLLFTNQDYR